mmetsp:Transcript_17794/g.38814  ORF Transcript_17794/g.38814 Transcript_17794/m.38814 type:complete len:375 (+) Transcript_17794:231-1355(+)
MRLYVSGLHCTCMGSHICCMRAASLAIEPTTSNWGWAIPTTPTTTGPDASPTRNSAFPRGDTSAPKRRRARSPKMAARNACASPSAGVPKATLRPDTARYPSPMVRSLVSPVLSVHQSRISNASSRNLSTSSGVHFVQRTVKPTMSAKAMVTQSRWRGLTPSRQRLQSEYGTIVLMSLNIVLRSLGFWVKLDEPDEPARSSEMTVAGMMLQRRFQFALHPSSTSFPDPLKRKRISVGTPKTVLPVKISLNQSGTSPGSPSGPSTPAASNTSEIAAAAVENKNQNNGLSRGDLRTNISGAPDWSTTSTVCLERNAIALIGPVSPHSTTPPLLPKPPNPRFTNIGRRMTPNECVLANKFLHPKQPSAASAVEHSTT